MMTTEQARQLFCREWESRSGSNSPMTQKLSPDAIQIWRILHSLPEKTAAALLHGTKAEPVSPPAAGKPVWPILLQVLLPAAVASLATWLRAPGWGVGLAVLVAAGGAAGICYKWGPYRSGAPAQVQPVIDDMALKHALDESQKVFEELFAWLAKKEQNDRQGYDITRDRQFGQWVQKFVDHVNRHEDNPSLQALKQELTSKLEIMGITVYDQLEADGSGHLLLPDTDFFRDARLGEQYTAVTRAIVYSRRGLLARGEIR